MKIEHHFDLFFGQSLLFCLHVIYVNIFTIRGLKGNKKALGVDHPSILLTLCIILAPFLKVQTITTRPRLRRCINGFFKGYRKNDAPGHFGILVAVKRLEAML